MVNLNLPLLKNRTPKSGRTQVSEVDDLKVLLYMIPGGSGYRYHYVWQCKDCFVVGVIT